ncbi:MAG: 2-keto-4-pentenoate hydratase [Sphingomonas bacterium]|uniref:2-keto-4-pentenoate hydratase n=1 Tax=Sphingomonas bacterium TaxID=1895847 RepID=UPI002605A4C4|nr:fumarylacetoacetate hydrolase family protein [Sphingomonas bacterium]MDB5705794.1 2-keto-4-pentenoate hydratase [Sphingomonas bacterium]
MIPDRTIGEMVQRGVRQRLIAASFVEARRAGTALDDYPGAPPASLEEAYQIQSLAIGLRGGRVAGWKVGRINPPASDLLGADRLAGPIFADAVIDTRAGGSARMSVIQGGFAAAEAEFLLRIGIGTDPAKKAWTLAEARALVDRVAIGIEIASSPLRAINDLGPAVTASDFGNNNGLLVGAELDSWRSLDLDTVPVAFSRNGVEIGRATTATMLDGPWGAVRFVAELMAKRGLALQPGQWISTGAVTGVHPVEIGDRVEARFGETQKLGCVIASQNHQP